MLFCFHPYFGRGCSHRWRPSLWVSPAARPAPQKERGRCSKSLLGSQWSGSMLNVESVYVYTKELDSWVESTENIWHGLHPLSCVKCLNNDYILYIHIYIHCFCVNVYDKHPMDSPSKRILFNHPWLHQIQIETGPLGSRRTQVCTDQWRPSSRRSSSLHRSKKYPQFAASDW